MQQLKDMIHDQVSQMNLEGVLDDSAIEQIKLKVMSAYNHEKAINEIPEIIPEMDESNSDENTMLENEFNENPEVVDTEADSVQINGQKIDQGTSGNIPAHTPELPYFLDKVQPGKLIIFNQNELSEGGENLSNKPIRTFADPDVKKSMRELWLENGQKRAEVFLSKLEKIGELEYDVANGTTVFTEKRFEPDFNIQNQYKENPYVDKNSMISSVPSVDDSQIVRQIASSVDLQKTVENIVLKMLQQQAIQANPTSNVLHTDNNIDVNKGVNKALEENASTTDKAFDLKMRTVADTFQKVDTPKQLKEAIEKEDKSFLLRENEEVQEWVFEGEKYYLPVIKISTRKCYIK
jgi:hypothetical protein